jgi:hypothetical protein
VKAQKGYIMAIVKQKGNTFFVDITKNMDVKKVIKSFENLIAEREKGTIRIVEKPEVEKKKGGSTENFVITGFSKDFSPIDIGNAIDKAQEGAKIERVYKQISRDKVRAADKETGRAANIRLVEPIYGNDVAGNIAKALNNASSYPDGRHIKVRYSYENTKQEKVFKNFTAWESKEDGKARKVNFKEEGSDKTVAVDIVRRKGTGKIEMASFAEALSKSKALGNAMSHNNNINVTIEQEVGKENKMRSVVNSVAKASEEIKGNGLVSVSVNFDGSNCIAKEAKQQKNEKEVKSVEDMGR